MDLNSFELAKEYQNDLSKVLEVIIEDETIDKIVGCCNFEGCSNPKDVRDALLSLKKHSLGDISALAVGCIAALPSVAVNAIAKHINELQETKENEEKVIYLTKALAKSSGMSDEEIEQAWRDARKEAELKRKVNNN